MEPSKTKDFLLAVGLLGLIATVLVQGLVLPLVIVAFAFMGFGIAMFMRARPGEAKPGIDLG